MLPSTSLRPGKPGPSGNLPGPCADLPAGDDHLREQRLAMELVAILQQIDLQQLFDAQQHALPGLNLLLHQLQQTLRQLSDSVTLSYFNHADLSSQWQSF